MRSPWAAGRRSSSPAAVATSARTDLVPTLTGWPAPYASGPVDAVVHLPGSKSVTNRALVLASLAPGRSVIRGPLRARDTALMAAALTALGADISDSASPHDWVVTGAPAGTPVGSVAVNLGNAGTVARFVPAVAALRTGSVVLDGDPRMRERPIAPLLDALRALGASISGTSFPVTVHGTGSLRGGAVTVDATASSQLVSGLLLAGPAMDEGLDLRLAGGDVPSRPHLDMTVAMLRAFGASVSESPGRWVVAPGGLRATDVDVEPDLSGAAPFLAAAAVTGGVVRVPGWPLTTTQPGAALPALLERMGATSSLDSSGSSGPSGLTLRGPLAGSRLHGIDADLRDCGELAPVLAAVACVATGPTTLRGIAHLRLQETDRLRALATELRAAGASVEELPDGLVITPGALRATTFATYDDHRLAMAAAVLGLAVNGLVVENVATVGKTMPDFVERWEAMLG